MGALHLGIIRESVKFMKEHEVESQTLAVSCLAVLRLSVVTCILSALWTQDLISLYLGDDFWCPGAFLQLMPTMGVFQGIGIV